MSNSERRGLQIHCVGTDMEFVLRGMAASQLATFKIDARSSDCPRSLRIRRVAAVICDVLPFFWSSEKVRNPCIAVAVKLITLRNELAPERRAFW